MALDPLCSSISALGPVSRGIRHPIGLEAPGQGSRVSAGGRPEPPTSTRSRRRSLLEHSGRRSHSREVRLSLRSCLSSTGAENGHHKRRGL